MLIKIKHYLVILLTLIYSLGNYSPIESKANAFWIDLKPRVDKYIRSQIDHQKYTYSLIGPVRNMTKFLGNRPGAPVSYTAINYNGASDIKNITVYSKDNPKEKLLIRFRLSEYKRVLVASKNIQAGEIITNSVKVIKKSISKIQAKRFLDSIPAYNLIARRNINAGAMISETMLKKAMLIHSGSYIKVYSRSAFITLEFRCKALSSGLKGEKIKVACPEIKKPVVEVMVEDNGSAVLL